LSRYLVDNSIWSRVATDEGMRSLVEGLHASLADVIVTCPPQVLEFCHPARTVADYLERRAVMEAFEPLRLRPEAFELLDVQEALWRAGLVRAVGPVDIEIAGWALVNDAVVLSADHDYALVAQALDGRLMQMYVAPGRRSS